MRPNSFELFNAALDAFRRADIPEAVVLLRGGFFENLYIGPMLLGEECHAQEIWYSGPDAEPLAAREYITRYGSRWEAETDSLTFLAEVWHDPLVRAELKTFINLSKNLLSARESELEDRLRERDLFPRVERLRRTQSEIVARLRKATLRLPLPRPSLGIILLASRDPAASIEFYRNLLELEPIKTSQAAGGYAEFELGGVPFAIHGQNSVAPSDPYHLGPPPTSFGWGAIFVFRVARVDRYFENASLNGIEIVDSDLVSAGKRYFVVKDPSGYLIEVTEEPPRGIGET
ncbi:MAG TPA: VOC family protein [Planctomycetota bacterium]|nr:VOC family protein [Planctomycetota bacterium]